MVDHVLHQVMGIAFICTGLIVLSLCLAIYDTTKGKS